MTEVAIALVHRGRVHSLPGATAVQTGPNVIVVTVPRTEPVRRLLRAEVEPEWFDGAVWMVGEVESVQSMGSADRGSVVEVTVLLP